LTQKLQSECFTPTITTNFEMTESKPPQRRCVLVCQHRSCIRNGAAQVLEAFEHHRIPGVFISASACLGQCGSGPTVQITPDQVWYCQVKPSDVVTIAQQHLQENQPVAALMHPRFHPHPATFTDS
jgi:(2Fe-2S) ferredoxin